MEKRSGNSIAIPPIGFGTSQLPLDDTPSIVRQAIECGYRMIDTAAAYENEVQVGEGIRRSGVPRGELFVTTKLKFWRHRRDDVLRECEASLKALGLDYVDLYLIHWPVERNAEAWRAMEEVRREGMTRFIGVCNYHRQHLDELQRECGAQPALNQIEITPRLQQRALREECAAQGIAVQAWSPLMAGKALSIPELQRIAAEREMSVSQIVLGWLIHGGVSVISRSRSRDHMLQNLRAVDYIPTEAELGILSSLENGTRIGPDPDTFASQVIPHLEEIREKEGCP